MLVFLFKKDAYLRRNNVLLSLMVGTNTKYVFGLVVTKIDFEWIDFD